MRRAPFPIPFPDRMTGSLRTRTDRLAHRLEHGDPFWPAQLAIAAAIALQFVAADKVTVGPRWLLAAVEGALFAALVVVLPRRATRHAPARRRFALTVIALVSATAIVSLGLLVNELVTTHSSISGRKLIESGVVLWGTTVLLFAVWFWELDRGGPVHRFLQPDALPDFQFPQMENPQLAPKGWRPGFGDYLYTSLTNATAFSPTDTMPLTGMAKFVMAIQSVSALATIGLVIARAVNILGG